MNYLGPAVELTYQHGPGINTPAWLGEDLIRVQYDRWLLEPEYRRAVCDAVGGRYSERELDQVPGYGFGSSFGSGTTAGLLTDRQALLERWRSFAMDEDFQTFVEDPEVEELGRRIFGLPGEADDPWRQKYDGDSPTGKDANFPRRTHPALE